MSEEDELIMRDLDEIYTKWPFYGQRKLLRELRKHGWNIGRKRTRRLMKTMGIEALVPKPSLSKPNKDHKIYPYLLRNLAITEVDQVWCTDITYTPMEKGHAYLVAIMDWKSRAVLSWELSNTMDSGFCVRALRNAMALTGRKPNIFNTDQGSQFTGQDWIGELKKNDILVSMGQSPFRPMLRSVLNNHPTETSAKSTLLWLRFSGPQGHLAREKLDAFEHSLEFK